MNVCNVINVLILLIKFAKMILYNMNKIIHAILLIYTIHQKRYTVDKYRRDDICNE